MQMRGPLRTGGRKEPETSSGSQTFTAALLRPLNEDEHMKWRNIQPGDKVGYAGVFRIYMGMDSETRQSITPPEIEEWLVREWADRIAGGTITYARGFWLGRMERTAVLEIAEKECRGGIIQAIARSYKETFEQDCVVLTAQSATLLYV